MILDIARALAVALGIYLIIGALPAVPVRGLVDTDPRPPLLQRVGASLRRRMGMAETDEALDRAWGATVVAMGTVLAHPAFPVLGLLTIWGRHLAGIRRAKLETERDGWAAAPEAVLVMALAVRSGANVSEAIRVVAQRMPGRSGAIFGDISRRLSMGILLEEAIEELPSQLGAPGESISRVIRRCIATGAELAPALERLAGELRAQQHQRQLEAARRLPVLLLFPLVSCTLPAFALLTVVPLLLSSLSQLAG